VCPSPPVHGTQRSLAKEIWHVLDLAGQKPAQLQLQTRAQALLKPWLRFPRWKEPLPWLAQQVPRSLSWLFRRPLQEQLVVR
jgi:hypothetical protein